MTRSLIPNSTQIPDIILDEWMADLEGAELKVVLYIARRTFGFGKRSDTISVSQMSAGITRAGGEVLDKGTGLSVRGVQEACNYLVECGVLLRKMSERNNAPSLYEINTQWDGELLDRKAWRARNKASAGAENAEDAPAIIAPPQRLHPRNGCTPPPQRLHPPPATVAPTRNSITRDSIQETDTPPCSHKNENTPQRGRSAKPKPVYENPPSLQDVQAFCLEQGWPELAGLALDFQEQRGWMMKSGPVTSWKAAIRTWKSNRDDYARADGRLPVRGKPNASQGGLQAVMQETRDALADMPDLPADGKTGGWW